MKLLTTLLLATTLHAGNLTRVSCAYTGYDMNFGQSFYTGVYRGISGAIYTYQFDVRYYSYCPWSL
jgi:hypothetical protein